jgi:acid stress chaperone HdeB
MKSIGVVMTAIALVMTPALAADKTIPLATMTCKQFVDSPKDTIGVILTWMMGYLQDEDEPAESSISARWRSLERSSAPIADRIRRTE